MQSVSAEAKATLSESQPHPSSSLSVWALFPPAGLERYCTAVEDSGSSLAQPACWLLALSNWHLPRQRLLLVQSKQLGGPGPGRTAAQTEEVALL